MLQPARWRCIAFIRAFASPNANCEEANMRAAEARIAVVSGHYPASSFEAFVNHRAYCSRHGYTYIFANWPTGERNRYLNKIRYIQAYHSLFDYIFWIDDDAFFLDLDR